MKNKLVLIASIALVSGSLHAGQYSSSLDNKPKLRESSLESKMLISNVTTEISRQFSENGKHPKAKHTRIDPTLNDTASLENNSEELDPEITHNAASSLRHRGNGIPRGHRS